MWLWATFEHIDAVPADPNNPGPTPVGGWGFFQPGSKKKPNQRPLCPDGTTPSINCDFQPTSSHTGTNPNDKTGGPTQAVRTNPIPKSPNQPALGQINSAMQSALRQINPTSVWQFYELVEAQWQVAGGFFPPNKVANMTMETYTQPASCMGCHQSAVAPFGEPQAVSADLTFELTLGWRAPSLPASRVPALTSNTPSKKSSMKTVNSQRDTK